MRRSDGRSDDGTFKNLYNNDLTTEGTARVILPVLLFARLSRSLSLYLSREFLSQFSPSLAPSLFLLRLSCPFAVSLASETALFISRVRGRTPRLCVRLFVIF